MAFAIKDDSLGGKTNRPLKKVCACYKSFVESRIHSFQIPVRIHESLPNKE